MGPTCGWGEQLRYKMSLNSKLPYHIATCSRGSLLQASYLVPKAWKVLSGLLEPALALEPEDRVWLVGSDQTEPSLSRDCLSFSLILSLNLHVFRHWVYLNFPQKRRTLPMKTNPVSTTGLPCKAGAQPTGCNARWFFCQERLLARMMGLDFGSILSVNCSRWQLSRAWTLDRSKDGETSPNRSKADLSVLNLRVMTFLAHLYLQKYLY